MIFTGRSFSGRERHCAFLNVGDVKKGNARFGRVSAISGLDLPDDGRSVVSVDWDHDGDLDFLVTNRNAPRLRYFRNDKPNKKNFIALRLQGNGTTTNRDAIGARVEVYLNQDNQRPMIKTLRAGEGFIGQSSKWLHFGLGSASQIKKVTVRWPGAPPQDFTDLQVNTRHHLIQNKVTSAAKNTTPRSLSIIPGEPKIPSFTQAARIPLAFRLPMVRVPYETFSGTKKWARFNEGNAVLVNLWASWCSPCLTELTEFSTRKQDIKKAGLQILALSVDGIGDDSSPANAQKWVTEKKLPFEVGSANPQLLSTMESLHHRQIPMRNQFPLPTSFLIDAKGRLAVIYKGPVSVDTLLTDLQNQDGDINQRFLATAAFPGRKISHPKIELTRRRTETLIRFRLAGDLEQSQRYIEAAIHYRSVIELSPEYAEAHNNLGNVLDRLGQFAEAETHLLEAIRLKPDFAFAHHNLGNTLLHQRSPYSALKSYQEAIKLDPSVPGFHLSLAKALLTAGKTPADAMKPLSTAIKLNAEFEPAHLLMGHLHEQLGEREKARSSYQTVLKINPNNSHAKGRVDALK